MNKNSPALIRFLSSAAASLVLLSSPGQAAQISYFLDQSNALTDGVNYLQVTVADGASGAIDFTVEVLDPLTGMAARNFGLQSFAFNVIPNGFAEGANVSNLPDGWRARNGRRMDGFGLFDIKLRGRGSDRLETLTFSITGVEGDTPADYAVFSNGNAAEGHQFFAARVAGFEMPDCDACIGDDRGYGDFSPSSVQAGGRMSARTGRRDSQWMWRRDWNHNWDRDWDHDWYDRECVTSAFFGGSTAVPLPGAAWLFGAGIAGILTRVRRRRPA